MKTRPRSLGERECWKISWITRWPGRSAGWALPGEDDLDRPVGVPQQPGEAVHVGEQQPGALVRREPAGEADRQHARVEDGLDLGEDRGRLAVARELAAQPAVDEDRQLPLLTQVGFPQLVARDARESLPEAVLTRPGVETVEVGVEMAGEQLQHGLADPGRAVDAVRDRRGSRRP